MNADHSPSRGQLLGIALVSATLLMTELALTRIFSVIMYYHFAFLAISIALFGLSASGVFAYLARRRLDSRPIGSLLAVQSLIYALCTIVALFVLVRMHVGLQYSPGNLRRMLAIYALAALPFFTGGLVITLAISRFASRINATYAADLIGAAAGCLILIPLLNSLGAPGVVLTAAAMSAAAAFLFGPPASRMRVAAAAAVILLVPLAGQLSGLASFDVVDTKGHAGDTVLFSKWNSFSRIGVYERTHGDWSVSTAYRGPRPHTRYMDIDSAASTPILNLLPDRSNAAYLRYELTAFAYHLMTNPETASANHGFTALVIGPGGGRDLASALVFGAREVDGVEINPIIADDVMRGQFLDFSGRIYSDPRVHITVDDGRSFVRRTPKRFDVIQASLVDTWAATAAGAYTLTENTLYTAEAFTDYLDHLTDNGVLTVTRWVMDGLRLVSLAQAACDRRGCTVADRLAIVRQDRVATFILKKTPLTATEVATIRHVAKAMNFELLYVPPIDGLPLTEAVAGESVDGTATAAYPKLIQASDRQRFFADYDEDITPTTDDRPFYFHTTKLKNQFDTAFGRSMLFGNGLSALLTLMAISVALVALFVIGPLIIADRGTTHPRGWQAWLVYFGALGAGFMLIEVAVLQRFVLLLGHPVYSLTVTLFSLLLGTGIGAGLSRRFDDARLRRSGAAAVVVVALVALGVIAIVTPLVAWAIPFTRSARMLVALLLLVPMGIALGIPMPTGIRLLRRQAPELVAWAWGINGALSVLGATLAIFIAMNWGFGTTLMAAAFTYACGLAAFLLATRRNALRSAS